MNCPPDIAETILQIIRYGILRARAAAWSGDSARSAIEADHIHNLPDLLQNYSPDKLQYYWEGEKPAFVAKVAHDGLGRFQDFWQALEAQVESLTPNGRRIDFP